ncbi:LysR substrate-binding domain-containing protein [Cupriavidus metallidurans]|jgi:LysR family transcriptional regulator, glycine cleavage system transcriptional activator|uniref:LysR substrate-binding domain-containing protein n=1 Tax=Cupriavidus metallidurans TaxID=119219 RepID=UPI000763AC9A|nr:LysR substrate-binding domain-containing protein [Cupriavidus metallidurans]KWW36297.1 Glycine cleavage system transcriptional activator [Cupriavidus metallidurans]
MTDSRPPRHSRSPHLPPLQALRALEAATRHRSFTRAAEELALTHSAISHHIRALENNLGTKLFQRTGLSMTPTSAGTRLAEQVRGALDQLESALREAGSMSGPPVVQLQVSVMADLANAWLIRRLPSLHAQAPELDLHLRLHAEISPPDPYAVDVGIWHQRVDLPGFECHNLIEDYVIAVASPALLARYPGFTVADLPRLPMLRFALRPWRDWLLLAGLPPDEPVRGPIFQDAGLMLQSAVAGLGVATARAQLAHDYIASGQLVQIGTTRIPSSLHYWVTWREGNPREKAILRFHTWLKDQIAGIAPENDSQL